MAIYLVQTPASFLTNILGQTLLPAFSQVQADKARTNRILIHVTSALVLVGLPAFVFMFFCGRSLITLVYGARYASATGPLIAASAVTLVNLLNAQITTVFYARGLPQLHRRCVFVMAIMMMVLIYPFAKWFGLVGGQLACLISVVVGYIFQLERVHHLTELDMSRYAKFFVVGVGLSLLVAAICLFTRPFAMLNAPAPNILFGILGCILAYGLIATILFKNKWDVVRWDS
jgi:O-antigen/teichoic acid export membrane protein